MLYVFHVDVGRMMNFDMTVALSSVENLKDTIERLHGIPAANIVLLVSGGEMLTHSTQVAYYSAGTDTNPIYMFLTGDIKLPAYMSGNEPDLDLREQVERCLELPAVYDTVVTRAQLALKMYELARDEERLSERLVHEQHLQQQGWSAVVANMEDLTDEFRQRYRNFFVAFDSHLAKRAEYLELLRCFGDDLTKLARIPILPGLMPLAEQDFHGFDELLETDDVFSNSQTQQQSVIVNTKSKEQNNDDATTDSGISNEEKNSTSPNKKLKMGNEDERVRSTGSAGKTTGYNLLQWITSRENHNTLKVMSEECIQGLGTFDHAIYDKLKHEVQSIIKLAEQSDVKEIKGLSERLCKLEEFKYKIKSMVQDQKELSTAFQQNQNRAMNLRDASILPDLCDSHKPQLQVMLQNQQKIREHRRCIAKAKDELGNNLHQRLKRIVWIENAMSEFDNRLLFYHRCLKRAERHITIIEQIHKAPNIYVAAVTEVVRRKIFSGEFCQWATQLAEDFDSIHSEEIKRRQTFNSNFEGHFLNILFPGMSDMPPTFANENPIVFDARLPNITKSDIDILSTHLPDLATQIQLPDMGPVINFFVSRSGEHQQERMTALLKQQMLPPPQRLSALQKQVATSDCSLGTDTETDFEKLSAINAPTTTTTTQSVATSTIAAEQLETMARSTLTERILMQSAGTLTDDDTATNNMLNVQSKAELERLRIVLHDLSQISLNCMRNEREQLQHIKAEALSLRENVQSELQLLSEQFKLLQKQSLAEQQNYAQECAAHAEQLQLLQAQLANQNNELQETEQLRQKCANLLTEMEQMRAQLNLAQLHKEQAIQEAREALIQEHKTELESLRCRFKLMTNMERTASDSSLEKLERSENVIELTQHEAILAEMRAALEAEKQRDIYAAIETERNLWLSKQFPLNSENMMVKMLEDKERQLDLMREQNLITTKENYQLKTRLDALTNEEGNSWLKEKIEYLNRDKNRLEEELNMEKSKRLEMETSFAALRGSTYEPSTSARVSAGVRNSLTIQRTVVLEACDKGDVVFVVWSMRHAQFMAVQDSQTLYFVHADSLAALNLRLPNTVAVNVGGDGNITTVAVEDMPIPMPYFAVGRVLGKEYCQAKKSENRYRVPRGTKFYRIKLAPYTSKVSTHRERLE